MARHLERKLLAAILRRLIEQDERAKVPRRWTEDAEYALISEAEREEPQPDPPGKPAQPAQAHVPGSKRSPPGG